MRKENPFTHATDGQGALLAKLSSSQRLEIYRIVRREKFKDEKREACDRFLDFIDASSSNYVFWTFGARFCKPTFRYRTTGRGRPTDGPRLELAYRVALAYKQVFGKMPSPWDNTRFNEIMRVVFEAVGCPVNCKSRRAILLIALKSMDSE